MLCSNHPEGLSRNLYEYVINDIIFGAETMPLPTCVFKQDKIVFIPNNCTKSHIRFLFGITLQILNQSFNKKIRNYIDTKLIQIAYIVYMYSLQIRLQDTYFIFGYTTDFL